MQITSKFTIAAHIIAAIDYFKDSEKVTSNFLAGSVGANPVIHSAMDEKLQRVQSIMENELSRITMADVVTDVRKAAGSVG